jgi:hypothetical protein
MCRPTLSPLDTVATTFRLLATGPKPLALHGHVIGLRMDSIGSGTFAAFCSIQPPASACSGPRWSSLSDGRAESRGVADWPRRGAATWLAPAGRLPRRGSLGGRRGPACLGQLGLQAQGPAGRRSARSAPLALSRAGTHGTADPTSQGLAAARHRRCRRQSEATPLNPWQLAPRLESRESQKPFRQTSLFRRV